MTEATTDILIQVHAAGSMVVIDTLRNWIGIKYPKDKDVEEFFDIDTDFCSKYAKCRFCNKPVDHTTLAFAFWRHEQGVCGSQCLYDERLKRFACCDQAKPRPCVCMYSTTCPVHGDRCCGTHD